MKRFFLILLVFMLCLSACGEEIQGFLGLSDDVVLELYEAVLFEMRERGLLQDDELQYMPQDIGAAGDSPLLKSVALDNYIDFYVGTYEIGKDLKAGDYMLEMYYDDYTSAIAEVALYADKEHMDDNDYFEYQRLSLLYSMGPEQYRFSVKDGMYLKVYKYYGMGFKLKLYY